MEIRVTQAVTPDTIALCLDIRKSVFIDEQNVSLERERDGLDGNAQHYLCLQGNIPIGTVRTRFIVERVKIERVAVLPAYRKQGIGKRVIQHILQQHPSSTIVLSAQSHTVPFYQKLGFAIASEEYLDDGIPHYTMELTQIR